MKRYKVHRSRSRSTCSASVIVAVSIFALLSTASCTSMSMDSSANAKPSSQPTEQQQQLATTSSRQGRQIPVSTSGVLASHYDANRLKPLPGSGTSRDASASVPSYNNPTSNAYDHYYGNYNSGGNEPHQQPQPQPYYSPAEAANAYYYYHYPDNMKAKLAYSGPHFGNDLGDYASQKTANLVDTGDYKFGSYISSFIRDLLPPPEADSKTDPLTLTGLASLVVSSLSGLSWVAIGVLAIILAPVLIPLVLAPLMFLLLLIYFIPVIRLDIPATGRGLSLLKHLDTTAHFYKRMIQNEECLERVSCEIARYAHGNYFEEWISKKLESSSNQWLHRFSRSFKAAKDGQNCQIFSCNPKFHLQKSLG